MHIKVYAVSTKCQFVAGVQHAQNTNGSLAVGECNIRGDLHCVSAITFIVCSHTSALFQPTTFLYAQALLRLRLLVVLLSIYNATTTTINNNNNKIIIIIIITSDQIILMKGGKWICPTLTPSDSRSHISQPPDGISIGSTVFAEL